jgi:phosphatidylserine/phosphatidylglycerophosphate/cardiolipin synthase-like enzyme
MMIKTSPIVLIILCILGVSQNVQARPASAAPRIEVLFSPGGGCTEAIIEAIRGAKSSIEVQAYSFTSAPIAKAVAEAHQRGVKVRVVLDKSQRTERYTSATYLHNQKVPVWIDSEHAIAHNKVILIDRSLILTGSFNFTKSAEERNAENLLIIQGHRELIQKYAANFEEHLAHAEPYEGLAKADDETWDTPTEAKPERREPVQRKPAAKRSRKAA